MRRIYEGVGNPGSPGKSFKIGKIKVLFVRTTLLLYHHQPVSWIGYKVLNIGYFLQ